ncbi:MULTISPECIES: TrkH family potassium uptake protein [Eubacteriales]|uniref:Trk system potassium uptake protein TrkH n=1 Tax=Bittarella massiliensis (ex Durand et al. 2017) TaxID=1720313 RepID=A0AAQ1ME31_9FIRM|nr:MULTISPECIES: potassium transporter TrkG [Eubacteriales]ERJ01176.1 potassium uptake protein, TrkH family [Clostridium sp. ATCC 29733]SHG10425.1 trk system potassium uptake protein TrkH [Bittarella massiliensis (ex Durand et al. 2017)]
MSEQTVEKKVKKPLSPTQIIVASFLLVITVGGLLLCLPLSSRSGEFTPFLDALFTATSATCVTGLIVVDTYLHFSFFGQLVILCLIQIGGLGLITFVTFFSVAVGKKMRFKNMSLAQESISAPSVSGLPHLVRMVVKASLLIEGCGTLLLCLSFIPRYGFLQGLWTAFFLAVSAFCNAGFDILGHEGAYSSLIHYTGDPIVIGTISALIVIGGLGFLVWADLYGLRHTKKLRLHTKIVLFITALLILLGTLLFCVLEWNNPSTMGPLSVPEKLGAGLFQSISCRTAGFNSIDLNAMSGFTKLVASILMFIGAGPASTGGGIKVTTFAVIVMTILSFSSGRENTVILKRRIDHKTVYKALTISALALVVVFITSSVMFYSIPRSTFNTPINAIFEACSAFGTVGLSDGLTGEGNALTHIITMLTMFIGRVGPASLAISLASGRGGRKKNQVMPEGKVLVG